MKKIIKIFGLVILMINGHQKAVSQQTNYSLPPLIQGQTTYTARDSVLLIPGFQFSGSSGTFHAKVDESIIVPAVYKNSTVNPDVRALDYNLPVGAIPAQYNVSSSGAFNYNIPIDVPPGTGSVSPDLSVLYSSYGNIGLLGMGWQLGGLSAICRTSSNIMIEGYIENDSYLINRFELDGMRLIPTTGTAGSTGTIYSTEIESYNRITSNGTINSGPESFKVVTKDGTVMEYGISSNSRVTIGGSGRIYKWLLGKVTDAKGNYMTYTYGQDATTGEYWPLKIDYTGNSSIGLSPYNSVKFFYEVRQDKQYYYKDGISMSNSLILKFIKIYCENTPVRTYTFNYVFDRSTYLNEIVVSNADGTHYNSTVFGWDNTNSTTNNLFPVFNNNRDNVFYNADFNGDGKEEILVTKKFGGYTTSDKAELYINNINGNFSLSSVYIMLNKSFKEFIKGDFDADGNADLFMVEVGVNNTTNDSLWKYTFYKSGTNGFTRMDDISFSYPHKPDIVTGDFNGDGITDILVTNTSNPTYNYEIQHFYIHSRLQTLVFGDLQGNIILGKRIITGDFNGNGKEDILVLFDNKSVVYEFNDKNTLQFELLVDDLSYPVLTDMSVQAGDFNGDGKSDIYTSSLTYMNSNKIGIFNGSSFVQYIAPTTYPTKISKPFAFSTGYSEYIVCDLNRDGKADLMEMRCLPSSGNTPPQIQAYAQISKWDNSTDPGVNFYQAPLGFNVYFDNDPTHTKNCYDYLFGDFNGNGTSDLFFYSYTWDSPGVYYGSDDKIKDLYSYSTKRIVTIADGMNSKLTVNYIPLTDHSLYTKEVTAYYPLADIQPAFMAVSKTVYNDGAAGDGTMKYSYSGSKIHYTGRGLLGNMGFTVTDQRTGLYQTNISTVMLTCQLPLVTEKTSGSLTDGLLIKENFIYTVSNPSTSVFSIVPNKKISRNYLTNVITTELTDSYDAYGNLLHSTTDINGFVYRETTNTYENLTNNGLYLLGRMVTSAVISKRPNETPITNNRSCTYEPYSNLLSRIVIEPNNNLGSRTDFLYNNAGCLTLISHSPINPVYGNTRNTILQYDSKFRFVTTETNTLNQSRSSTYEPVYGNVLTSTDYLGLTTTNTYNSFGKLIRTTLPDNNSLLFASSWVTSGQPANAIFKNTVLKTGVPAEEVYYDLKGRQLQTRNNGFDQTVYTDFYYNNKGLLTFLTDPYYAGDVPNTTQLLYDNLGRNIQVALPGNRTYNYSYNGLQTTTNAMGKTSSKTLDATGLLISASDYGGTIAYSYYSNGKLKKVNLPDGQETQMQYDINGNQTMLHEPNTGTSSYTYNPFGELLTQVDSKGNTSTMTYDGLGRMTTKSDPDMTSTYYYNSTNGLLTGISSTNGTGISYIYDNFGRVTQQTEMVDGSNYSIGYNYNTLGNVSDITYPNGFVAKYLYNPNNHLGSIINGSGNIIWQNNEFTAKGQLLTGKYGNGLDLTNVYNGYGFLIVSTVSGQMPLQDFGYTYNSEGNLTFRNDWINGQYEYFGYDNLNRLSSVSCNGNAAETITYFENGNIYQKQDAGEYGYGTATTLPNGVIGLNVNQGVSVPAMEANYTYNASGKLSGITEGDYALGLTYGPGGERVKSTLTEEGSPVKSKIFIGGLYERHMTEQGEREICYIGGYYGAVAAYISDNGQAGSYYYIHRDHLGSVTTITNNSGAVVERHHYDAWGNTCDPDDWSSKVAPDLMLGRGYTGHEHLTEFGLINMNGRVYDPFTGRFMSADPFVQEPGNTQSYNRYSYCMNNPLNYTDLSGFIRYNAEYPVFVDCDWFRYVGGGGHIDWSVFNGGNKTLEQMAYHYAGGIYYDWQGREVSFEKVYNNFLIKNANTVFYYHSANGKIKELFIHATRSSKSIVQPGGYHADENGDYLAIYCHMEFEELPGNPVHGGFDVDKAVDYLNSNAHESSQGACSKYVQNALIAGGIKATNPVHRGGAYGPLLKKWGFTMITATLNNYTPLKGDIGVIQGYPGGTTCSSCGCPCGHIQMYNGSQWVSDFFQSTNRPFYPGPAYQKNAPDFEIYRWQ